MTRQLRIEYPGAIYHVTSRGNAQITIYADDADRGRFLQTLAEVVAKHHWLCHAYCLMGNHYHLLIETPEGNLSTGMQQLNGVYTQGFNRRHHAWGTCFKAATKPSWLIEIPTFWSCAVTWCSIRCGLAW